MSTYLSFNPFQSSYCFVSLARCRHDSCDARMSQEKNLHNDSSSLIGHFAADTFDFFLAVLTQEVDAYACALPVADDGNLYCALILFSVDLQRLDGIRCPY
jgi:hypothetical protein